MREWKPGDVAAWDMGGRVEVIYFRHGGHDFNEPGWQTARDGEGYPKATELRPLVVIDPEDAEQVTRLNSLYWIAPGPDTAMRDALREFADPKPPKPDEPTGLGAVVEDAEGIRWVREASNHRGLMKDTWRATSGSNVGAWSKWENFTAVKVLSEGVTS